MFGVNVGGHPAALLRLSHHMQRDGGLAALLRTENLNHSAPWHATHTQRRVKGNRTRGDDVHRHQGVLRTQSHDGALAKLFLDLDQRQINGLVFFSSIFRHYGFPRFSRICSINHTAYIGGPGRFNEEILIPLYGKFFSSAELAPTEALLCPKTQPTIYYSQFSLPAAFCLLPPA
jgi:hypothetical protein